jgi:iron-sulfur cluster repair protein YtfE (RIC family)
MVALALAADSAGSVYYTFPLHQQRVPQHAHPNNAFHHAQTPTERQEYLFEQLGQLLSSAVAQSAAARAATVRQLVCKVEAIHTTLRKHLAKEEAQLLPLLLHHFTFPEQAELVAQFLYCIPLDTVERVVGWLRPAVPPRELQQLLTHLTEVVPDNLLLQLLATWLDPGGAPPTAAAAAAAAEAKGEASEAAVSTAAAAAPAPAAAPSSTAAAAAAAPQWPPLQGIVLFHESIKGALEAFATEAAALQAAPGGASAAQLAGLVERHRFLRSVCAFHTHSEEEVMFPEVMRLSKGAFPAGAPAAADAAVLQSAARLACSTCQREHAEEVSRFEELGRLLADVRALARRGRREAAGMLGQLVHALRRVCSVISAHMRREEADVLPLLAAALPAETQREMVWRTLRAMPLRLLERVMPWLVAKLSAAEAEGLTSSLRLAAPDSDKQVVELLLRWAERGRWGAGAGADAAAATAAGLAKPRGSGDGGSECSGDRSMSAGGSGGAEEAQQPGSDDPALFVNDTCGLRAVSGSEAAVDGLAPRKRARSGSADGSGDQQGQPGGGGEDHHQQRPRWQEGQPHPDEGCCGCTAAAGQSDHHHHHHQHQPATHHHQQQQPQGAAPPAGAPLALHVPPPAARGGSPDSPMGGVKLRQAGAGVSPIDHIFQFHKALRQELRQLETDAAELEASVFADPAPDAAAAAGGLAPGSTFRRRYAASLQQLDGRFQFLWGIYRWAPLFFGVYKRGDAPLLALPNPPNPLVSSPITTPPPLPLPPQKGPLPLRGRDRLPGPRVQGGAPQRQPRVHARPRAGGEPLHRPGGADLADAARAERGRRRRRRARAGTCGRRRRVCRSHGGGSSGGASSGSGRRDVGGARAGAAAAPHVRRRPRVPRDARPRRGGRALAALRGALHIRGAAAPGRRHHRAHRRRGAAGAAALGHGVVLRGGGGSDDGVAAGRDPQHQL